MKALITGASSGLGEQFLRIHSARGYDSVIVARSEDKLNQLKEELEKKNKVKIEVLVKDLSKAKSSSDIYDQLKDSNIELVINNAGFGYKSDFLESDIKKQVSMIDLNIKALTELTYYFGKDFKDKDSGKILNIASVAAFLPGINQAVYYASKAYVRSFSRAVGESLKDSNASITILNPGATRTEFFDSAGVANFKGGADPYEVALLGYNAAMNGKAEVTHGLGNKFMVHFLAKLIPAGLAARIAANSGV